MTMITTAAELINLEGGDPATGMCLCPAHDDNNPSLHVSDGRDGLPLLYCFAGCTYDQVRDALRGKGIELPRRSGSPTQLSQRREETDPNRGEEDRYHRLRSAYGILRGIVRTGGYERASLFLARYLKPRGIEKVPAMAMLSLTETSDVPAMVFPVVNHESNLLGVVPENSIRWDSRGETESAHHPMRWLRLSTCLRRL
jgi:hypothetical protein